MSDYSGATVPCDLSIVQLTTSGQFEFVRVVAKDHLKVIAQFDMSMGDFARLVMGETVTAAYNAGQK